MWNIIVYHISFEEFHPKPINRLIQLSCKLNGTFGRELVVLYKSFQCMLGGSVEVWTKNIPILFIEDQTHLGIPRGVEMPKWVGPQLTELAFSCFKIKYYLQTCITSETKLLILYAKQPTENNMGPAADEYSSLDKGVNSLTRVRNCGFHNHMILSDFANSWHLISSSCDSLFWFKQKYPEDLDKAAELAVSSLQVILNHTFK